MINTIQEATLGAGCFWCVEACFQRLEGVIAVEPGYAGGSVKAPTYKAVCAGNTGHAEVARIRFDAEKISFDEILAVFWHIHDPTTLNRQGNDVGTQYRSVIYYHNDEQKAIAEKSLSEISATDLWANPIVTEISALSNYSTAEAYHHNYFNQNPNQSYCAYVVNPKVQKFKKRYADKLKKEA
jgi:peptide-methionine (S)-S-oxide reductase